MVHRTIYFLGLLCASESSEVNKHLGLYLAPQF
jgi:hypothetical protein